MRRKHTVLVVVAALAVGLDQLVKAIARLWPVGARDEWLPGVVHWVHVENVGGVLGILRDWPDSLRLPLFALAAIGVGLVAWGWLRGVPPSRWWSPACLGLVVGGAIGNGLDRLARGSVTDVFVLGEAALEALPPWLRVLDGVPAFNLADAFLGLGLVGLAVAVASRLVRLRRGRDTALDPPHPPG